MKPEVTIGIPVYRSVDYIEKTMLSALAQTFKWIEFLVVDDCGADGSIDILAVLQQEHCRGDAIRILHNDANRGVSFSRNRIIDEAQGRFLFFLDSDDLIEPDTIQKLYDAMYISKSQMVYGSYQIEDHVNMTPTRVYQKPQMFFSHEDELARYVYEHIHQFHVSACNLLIDLSFLRDSGIRFPAVLYWEDMAFTTELVTKVSRAVLLPDITYHYILHNNSLSHYQKRDRLDKKELLNNISVLDSLKQKCVVWSEKSYVPFLCFNIEVNSFYVICDILRKSHIIYPRFSNQELQRIIWHPMSIKQILKFRHKRIENLFFWLLAVCPNSPFTIVIKLLGKLKRCI